MQQNSGAKFTEAMRRGQSRLTEAPASLRQIGEVFSAFGHAVHEFSQGAVGVGCVMKGSHVPVTADFAVGIPMSVVLVSHVRPETPSRLVADLQVSQFGFPVVFAFNGSRHSAFNADAVSDLLAGLSHSDVFASALHGLMAVEAAEVRYQS